MTAFLVVGAVLTVCVVGLAAVIAAIYAIVRGLWVTVLILLELRQSRKDQVTAKARDRWKSALRRYF